jgi:hypothetical protein
MRTVRVCLLIVVVLMPSHGFAASRTAPVGQSGSKAITISAVATKDANIPEVIQLNATTRTVWQPVATKTMRTISVKTSSSWIASATQSWVDVWRMGQDELHVTVDENPFNETRSAAIVFVGKNITHTIDVHQLPNRQQKTYEQVKRKIQQLYWSKLQSVPPSEHMTEVMMSLVRGKKSLDDIEMDIALSAEAIEKRDRARTFVIWRDDKKTAAPFVLGARSQKSDIWLEEGSDVSEDEAERIAHVVDTATLPLLTALTGTEPTDVDGNGRISILIANTLSVDAYVDMRDVRIPAGATSNGCECIVVRSGLRNAAYAHIDPTNTHLGIDSTIAHELQHMLSPSLEREEWIDEGLSELAAAHFIEQAVPQHRMLSPQQMDAVRMRAKNHDMRNWQGKPIDYHIAFAFFSWLDGHIKQWTNTSILTLVHAHNTHMFTQDLIDTINTISQKKLSFHSLYEQFIDALAN